MVAPDTNGGGSVGAGARREKTSRSRSRSRNAPPPLPPIVVDTREQRPYEFSDSLRGTLGAGDYSLVGCETRVAIERKSLPDACGSIGAHRARFLREWERLAALEYAAVVIEASLPQILTSPPIWTGVHPRSVVSTYLAWSVRFGVPVIFAGDRLHAQAAVKKLLQMWWRYHGSRSGSGEE